ncbi:MAG: FAD-dependent oxidoreductase [Hydrogenophaga sp.]|uniref:FAD-dependent oxidoreductase n=1 Tax=Hydrogenophaga sp. TaxID=1904254 RepID=UPI003D9B5CD3
MKIAVIGAGVIGVTTAYELTLDGHEVSVFDRHGTAGEGASFANGSLMVPGWPSSLGQEARWPSLLAPGGSLPGALRLGSWPGPGTWGWLWRRQRALRSAEHQPRQAALFQLARYSQERLAAITDEHQLRLDSSQGVLLLWRQERDATQARAALATMREWGAVAREVDAAQARLIEPALNAETSLHGALELPAAQSTNTRQFTLLLKNLAQQRGCRFEFGRAVVQLRMAGQGVQVVCDGSADAQAFDHAVVCTGAASDALLRPLGLQLPLQPVYGHSVSAAIREPLDAPLSAVIDARHQVSVTRLGQRVRVAGGRSLGGSPTQHSKRELERLYRVLMDWFPGAARLGGPRGSVQEWRGVQACLPDGAPMLGASPVQRVWLNLGHCSSGWSMACGSARALADQLQGRSPALDIAPFAPARWLR